jgi:hypothetical protein
MKKWISIGLLGAAIAVIAILVVLGSSSPHRADYKSPITTPTTVALHIPVPIPPSSTTLP